MIGPMELNVFLGLKQNKSVEMLSFQGDFINNPLIFFF